MNHPGKIIRDIPPHPDNPRNSEGAFMTLKNGDILFIYSAFKGDNGLDHGFTNLKALRSTDGGETFEDDGIVLTCEGEKGVNTMSVSLLRMGNGDIGLFYLVRTTYTQMQMFMRRSSDEGKTWSERVCCTPMDGYFVSNNDRVIRLSNGRIIVPISTHRATNTPNGGFAYDSYSDLIWFGSEDDGRTFHQLRGHCALEGLAHSKNGLQEPGVVERSPGVLWGWARTDLGRQYEMFSFDGGDSWTSAQPSAFTSPCSPLCMKRLPDGRICVVWNPVPIYNGRSEFAGGIWTGGRTPLAIAFSKDDGLTFTEPLILDDDPESGYCYCAIHPVEDGLLLAYCAGGPVDKDCRARLRIRKISWEELN